MKTVRKKAAAATGVSGFFSGKVNSSVALPITDVEAQAEGYIIPDESSIRVVMDEPDGYMAAEEERNSSSR